MIHHLSIAARDPKRAAEVLAELMGGTAVPFPPNPGSFFALQLDEYGSGVEVYPAGTELQPGDTNGGRFVRQDRRGYGATHFALSVATDAASVQQIASRAGWHCFDCNRGPFHVNYDPEIIRAMIAREPIGRLGEPEEIAGAVVWLCTPAASFMTGHAMAIDGGILAQ